MKRVMTKLLNLPGVIVEDSKETKETLILSVIVEKKTAACPRCGEISHCIHQNKSHLVRDLPMGVREVVLKVNRRRFKCEKCQKPFSETLDFVRERKHFTYRYVEGINHKLKLLKRCGFGFNNFDNFKIRALLLWHFPQNLAH